MLHWRKHQHDCAHTRAHMSTLSARAHTRARTHVHTHGDKRTIAAFEAAPAHHARPSFCVWRPRPLKDPWHRTLQPPNSKWNLSRLHAPRLRPRANSECNCACVCLYTCAWSCPLPLRARACACARALCPLPFAWPCPLPLPIAWLCPLWPAPWHLHHACPLAGAGPQPPGQHRRLGVRRLCGRGSLAPAKGTVPPAPLFAHKGLASVWLACATVCSAEPCITALPCGWYV